MKDNVFKVVWVDGKRGLWSAMKGQRGFYRNDLTNIWKCTKALRYRPDQTIAPAVNMKPYIFAFASVACAVSWATFEFDAVPKGKEGKIVPGAAALSSFAKGVKRFNKGYLQVWEARGDLYNDNATVLSKDDEDQWIVLNAPQGTLFCKSLKLLRPVGNLF